MKTLINILLIVFVLQSSALAAAGISMSTNEKKQLDTFFTHFTEPDMRTFRQAELTDDPLIHTAPWHIVFNLADNPEKTNGGYKTLIPQKLIDELKRKYLDKVVSDHQRSVHTFGPAAGEVTVFSQVDALTRIDDGPFQAKGTVYYIPGQIEPDPHAAPKTWSRKGIQVGLKDKFTARPKKSGNSGDERYILLEYDVTEQE